MTYPDLVADYEKNWKHRGVSLNEYGQMHANNDPKRLQSYQAKMSGGGGGSSGSSGSSGGGGSSAQDAYMAEIKRQEAEAKRKEEERKALVKKNNASINAAFDKRAGEFDAYGNKLFEHNKGLLDDQRGDAQNQVNYALARSGHMGGSVDANQNAELEKLYQRGLTNLRSGANDQVAGLKANDNAMRNNLLGASAAGSYSDAMMKGLNPITSNMSQLNAGVGNQFQSLLTGIGGASRATKSPWGY